MKNKIILTGVFLLFSFFASAQIDYDVPINQYNANGQKEGFWREKIDEGTIFELYYINGKRSGVFKYFSMQNVKLNHYIAVFERVVLLCKICEQQTSNRIESLAIESGCIRE